MTLENSISGESTNPDGTQPPTRPARRRAVRTAAPAGAPVANESTPTVAVTPAVEDIQIETAAPTRPTRSRRAVRTTQSEASAPSPAVAPVEEAPATEAALVSAGVEPAPTEPTARRSRARTAPAAVADDQDSPKTRSRRRATAPRAAESVIAAEVAPEAETEPDSAEDAVEAAAQPGSASAPEPVAGAPRRPNTTLLFQAPDPTAARPRRRRASTPAGSPEAVSEAAGAVHAELAMLAAAAEVEQDTGDTSAVAAADVARQDGSPDESVGSGRARRSRRGARRAPDEQDVVEPAVVEAALDEDDEIEAEVVGDADLGDGTEPDEGAPRRRRRRGGRGRRGRAAGDDTQDQDGTDEDAAVEDDEVLEEAASDGAVGELVEDETGTGSSRRRRRRRRSGRGGDGDGEQTASVAAGTTRGRQPRPVNDEVTALRGSTRLEAKRQRRREGRDAGRRRTIVTESEFLARRESVDRSMVVREVNGLTQIAVLEDGVLVEHYISSQAQASMAGNVYLGRVQNVLPSMEAAFVDIGRGRNAVLYAGEVDWDAFGSEGQSRQVEKVFSSGQSILVQVTKDPVGAKGARLTAHISLPGRYLVYAPGGHLSGISRKLPEQERNRLKDILGDLVADDASVIIRTAAEGVSEEELVRDITRLKAQWEAIEKKVKQGSAPQMLYGEPDLTVRIVRDLFTEDFTKLVVDSNGKADDAYDTVSAYVNHVAPHLADRVHQWNHDSDGDLFTKHRIDEQIAKALERKVFLPSGGSLIIDRTEAMTVIDVNTGKFTGSGGNLEATVTANNLEAAEEIVRQLRLRDIGGIIVIDFIDMVLPSNRDLLLRRLVECLGRDRTRHQVAEVTSLGLVQMTRKKIGTGLAEAFTEPCEVCHGRGYHRHDEPVDTQAPADGGDRRRRH